jgi:hypothetical protein
MLALLALATLALLANLRCRRPTTGASPTLDGKAEAAPLHGGVRKAGPIPLSVFHRNLTRAYFQEQAKPWMAALKLSATPDAPPCRFWCQVWVNRPYRRAVDEWEGLRWSSRTLTRDRSGTAAMPLSLARTLTAADHCAPSLPPSTASLSLQGHLPAARQNWVHNGAPDVWRVPVRAA